MRREDGAAPGGGLAARDRILLSFDGVELSPAAAAAIARRAAGVTLYRHLNVRSSAQVAALTDTLQSAATRLGLGALVIGADHETGQLHAMGPDATPFAGAMALGATGEPALAERVGRAIGTELRAMGVTLVYGPVCDLATNPRNPVVGIRSFGDVPEAVGRLVGATVRGLQAAGVAATAKHFPGHGEPTGDSHHGLAVIERSVAELRERELVPFEAAIRAGARVVMAGHLAVPALSGRRDLPATIAPQILGTLLRGALGFGGLTVSDALDMGGIAGPDGTGVDVAASLAAGTDLLLCGPDPAARQRVEAGLAVALAGGRLDQPEAVRSAARVADLRQWQALFGRPPIDVVGSAAHRELADELARRSITVIRDRDRLVPLGRDVGRVLVIEPRPRDLTPADTTSLLAAGGLATAIRAHQPATDGVVVAAVVADDEIAALRERAADADLVVLGTVDALGEPSVASLARALVSSGTPVVAVALRGPWDADAYPEVGTVLATYGIQVPSLTALASVLWGDATSTGRLPVRVATAS